MVHNLPVATDLHRQFPAAQIDWLVEEAFVDIPRLHPAVQRVIPVAIRRWRKALLQPRTWREIRATRRQLQQSAYDLVLDTQGLLKSALLVSQTLRSATGRRCGHAAESAREPLAARFYDATYAIPKNVHAVERNRWLAAAACDYSPDLPLDYGLSSLSSLSNVGTWPTTTNPHAAWPLDERPYAVLLTATSRDDKLWSETAWLQLIAALHTQGIHCLLPAGSASERERAQRLVIQANAANATNASKAATELPPLSIRELAQCCAGARLVIGVDTGLTHLAVALARPTLAIYCASNPQLTGVYSGEPAASPVINLGQQAAPPAAAEVIDHALSLLHTAQP